MQEPNLTSERFVSIRMCVQCYTELSRERERERARVHIFIHNTD